MMKEDSFASSDAAPEGRSGDARAALVVIFLLFLLEASLRAAHADFRFGFDEIAHISYVAELQRSGEFWPSFDRFKLLNPSTFRFSGTPNYLNHPPFYYWVLARLCPTIEGHPETAMALRALNILLASIGFASIMALGAALKLRRFEAYAYGVPIFAIPALSHVAGSVSNDNLALAGGGIALLAAERVLASAQTSWFLALLAGVVSAGFAKLTGLVLVASFAAGAIGILALRGRFHRSWLAAVLAAGLIAATPYLLFLAQYGQPAPDTPGATAFLRCFTCMFENDPATGEGDAFNRIAAIERADPENGWRYAPRLSFPSFSGAFVGSFLLNWAPIPGERSMARLAMLALPILALLCGLWQFLISARRMLGRTENATDGLVVVGWLAIGLTFACHLIFSYRHHVKFAYIADAFPRYYLPLAAVVALSGVSLLQALREPRLRSSLAGFFVLSPLAFQLLGVPWRF